MATVACRNCQGTQYKAIERSPIALIVAAWFVTVAAGAFVFMLHALISDHQFYWECLLIMLVAGWATVITDGDRWTAVCANCNFPASSAATNLPVPK